MRVRKKRSICFILAIFMLIITIGENKIHSYAEEVIVEEDSESEETKEENYNDDVVENIIMEENSESEETEDEIEKIQDGVLESSENILQNITPEITLLDAYDRFISMRLGIPEEIVLPKDEKFFYEVKVTLNNENDTKVKTFLFEKEDSNIQEALMEIQEGTMKENEKWIYEISVKLVAEKKNIKSEDRAFGNNINWPKIFPKK